MTAPNKRFVNACDADGPLDIIPVAGRIGAEVRGIQLSGDLGDVVTSAIRSALVRHKVIFFRNQQLDDAGQEALTARLGEPIRHPTVPPVPGTNFLLDLDTDAGYFGATNWHTDATFTPAYPAASILRAIDVPVAGGDTMWANAVTAYDDLPPSLKLMVDDLRAVHSNDYDYTVIQADAAVKDTEQHKAVFASTVFRTEHPVVRVHPESGERLLLVGGFLKYFVGYNPRETARLLELLQDFVTRPENTVRWHWRNGDVAIWDNRATQHRAVGDFGPQHRHLRRSTIVGAVPVGVDGRESLALG